MVERLQRSEEPAFVLVAFLIGTAGRNRSEIRTFALDFDGAPDFFLCLRRFASSSQVVISASFSIAESANGTNMMRGSWLSEETGLHDATVFFPRPGR
ncbi:hypothetical protein [Agrobacterium pusense]|uniref:hypothetical protein n=1 Tax=Agrobacterium pusense TaxID=648995 RepID=UPI0021CE211A|nr:hypothetical protein [Agrobacterium pusense]UXT92723.1 hypothetical protein FY130_25090 [Agrobacterium pusense]